MCIVPGRWAPISLKKKKKWNRKVEERTRLRFGALLRKTGRETTGTVWQTGGQRINCTGGTYPRGKSKGKSQNSEFLWKGRVAKS